LKWVLALILVFACAPLSAQNEDVQVTRKRGRPESLSERR